MLQFPTNPAIDDVYTYEGRSWEWNGFAWVALGGTGGGAPVVLDLEEFDLYLTTSGAEVILGPFDCDEVVLHLEDVSSTGGPTQGLELQYSTDGVAYTSWGEVATHTSGAQQHNQVINIRGMKEGRMHAVYSDSIANSPPFTSQNATFGIARPAAQVTHFKMLWSALADFDGGAIRALTPGGI